MNPRAVLSVLGLAFAGSGCAVFEPTSEPAHVVRGPLAVKTNGPIAATLLQFRPREAATTPVGGVRLGVTTEYSSMFEDGTDGSSTVVFDGELLRLGVAVRTGLSATTDVEFELPLAYATSGFLDQFIETWHDVLGLPNGGREKREQGLYDMRVRVDGQQVYELEGNELAFGDVPIVITHGLVQEAESGFALALRGGIELPTGSESSGVGNGGLDWGGGVIFEKSHQRFTFTAGAYFVDPANPDSFADAGLSMDEQFYLHGGVECRWNELVSLIGGVRASTATTQDVTIEEVDGEVVDVDLGVALGEQDCAHRFSFGITDDVVAQSGPDFSLFFSWSYQF
jgi:hypothetical protein